MQCSCGNEMRDHKIQRNRQIVAEYKRCIVKESRGLSGQIRMRKIAHCDIEKQTRPSQIHFGNRH